MPSRGKNTPRSRMRGYLRGYLRGYFNWLSRTRPDTFKTGVIAHVEFQAEKSAQTSPCNPTASRIVNEA